MKEAKVASNMISKSLGVKAGKKMFSEKATDTGDDMSNARSFGNLAKIESEIVQYAAELDEETK
jgi:hypothetical protein